MSDRAAAVRNIVATLDALSRALCEPRGRIASHGGEFTIAGVAEAFRIGARWLESLKKRIGENHPA